MAVRLIIIQCLYMNLHYSQNKSLWVPLLRNSKVNLSSFCSHSINQSGVMWHSHIPSRFPWSLCDLYDGGSLPSLANFSTAFSMRVGSSPRFTPFRRDFFKFVCKVNRVFHSKHCLIKSWASFAWYTLPALTSSRASSIPLSFRFE